MSIKKLREALAGTVLPPEAEEAIASAEEQERQDASYTDYLESEVVRLKSALGEQGQGNEGHSSMTRKEWEQSKGKSRGLHVQSLTFNQSTGTHVDASTGTHYCTRCLSENKRSPLKNEAHGWRCMVCGKSFDDPSRPYPLIESWHPSDPGVGM